MYEKKFQQINSSCSWEYLTSVRKDIVPVLFSGICDFCEVPTEKFPEELELCMLFSTLHYVNENLLFCSFSVNTWLQLSVLWSCSMSNRVCAILSYQYVRSLKDTLLFSV